MRHSISVIQAQYVDLFRTVRLNINNIVRVFIKSKTKVVVKEMGEQLDQL